MKTLITCFILLSVSVLFADGVTIKSDNDAYKLTKYTLVKRDTLLDKQFRGLFRVKDVSKNGKIFLVYAYKGKYITVFFTTDNKAIIDYDKGDYIVVKGVIDSFDFNNQFIIKNATFSKYTPPKPKKKKTQPATGNHKYDL